MYILRGGRRAGFPARYCAQSGQQAPAWHRWHKAFANMVVTGSASGQNLDLEARICFWAGKRGGKAREELGGRRHFTRC